MEPGGQFMILIGLLQICPKVPWTLTPLFICKLVFCFFIFVVTQYGTFLRKQIDCNFLRAESAYLCIRK